MIRVYRDPFDATDYREHAHRGPLIDWLELEYPAGFDTPHQIRVNGDLLPVADYDRVIGPDDRVEVLIQPGEFITATMIANAIIGAVISAAISYVANALFGSKPSKTAATAQTPAAARVNSLGVPTNGARLGEPIPVQYGRLRSTPDLAAEPYRWYSGQYQYIGAIFCLGHGEFDIHDIYVSDTKLSQLAPGVGASWQFYAPTTMGTIEAATGVIEDIETSVEVSDQELQAPASTASYGAADAWTGVYSQTITATTLAVRSSATPAVMRSWGVGDALTITEYKQTINANIDATSGTADSTSVAAFALTAPPTGGTVTGSIDVTTTTTLDLTTGDITVGGIEYSEIQSYSADLASVSADRWSVDNASAAPSADATLYRVERDAGGVELWPAVVRVAGPYAAVGPGRKVRGVQIDIECPALFKINDETGSLMQAGVGFQVVITEIDDAGAEVATLATYNENINEAINGPVRRTWTYPVDPPARVAVAVGRTNVPSDRAQDADAAFWTQLRGIRQSTSTPIYGNVTLLAVRLRATDGISSGAANQISVDCSRKLGGLATSNPAIILRDAWTSTVYGGRRALSELDTDAIDAMETAAAGENGFNFRFTAQRSLWSALQAIIRPVDYFPIPLGAQISVARDAASSVDALAFTTANMLDVSRLCQWDRTDQSDGFELTYTDPATGTDATVYYPSTTADPESVTLEGCTDQTTAEDFARGLWQRQQYRREYLTFTTELGGHLAPIGQRVAVTHPLVGSAAYVVQSVEPLDEHQVRITGWRYDARQYA